MLKPITRFIELYSDKPYKTESGEELRGITAAYQTYGQLNKNGDNAVLICHALTGNAHCAGIITEEEAANSQGYEYLEKYNRMFLNKTGWWDPLIGPGKVFDTDKYFVISINITGSCYGSTGPSSLNPDTGKKYNMSFPNVTVRDIVRLQKEVIDYLGVKKIKAASGGSLGGMQVLEWGAMYGDMVEKIIPIATSAAHSAWAIGINEVERKAIMDDPAWKNGEYEVQPLNGLSQARQIAMLTYRSFGSFGEKFGRKAVSAEEKLMPEKVFQVQSYLDYQGTKLVNRFDANTYIYLANIMDNHDISRGRGSLEEVLGSIPSEALVIGISSDILYPPEEQREIAAKLKNARYAELESPHGHDAFLIEFDQLKKILGGFL